VKKKQKERKFQEGNQKKTTTKGVEATMEDKGELQLEGRKRGGKRTEREKEGSARARERRKTETHRERENTAGKKHKTHSRRSNNTTKT
jgi:hypothetical protein